MSLVKFTKIFFAGIVFIWLFAACTEPECTTITDPRLRIRFIIEAPTRTSSGLIQELPRDTTIRIVRVTGIGNTSGKLVSNIRNNGRDTVARDITAFLSQVDSVTAYVIEWDTARLARNRGVNSIFQDTLRVKYERQPYFVSEGCGFNYKFRNIEIDKETFTRSRSRQVRSVTIANPVADETLQPNITILFNRRPR